MRNLRVVGLGMSLFAAFTVGAEVTSPFSVFDHVRPEKVAEAKQKAPETSMNISELASKLKPTFTKTYGWNGRRWVEDDAITYTYDAKGNPVSEVTLDGEGDYTRTEYVYNENGKVTYKESKVSRDGVNYTNYKKTEFEYDPILTNVITRRTEWLWMSGDWLLVGNNYERRITRNENGNVTSVVIAVLFQGYYDPTQKLDITYGDNGEATTISEQLLNYDGKEYFWEQGLKISDIEWETTDGQIYNAEMLFLGKNKIKSCHYNDGNDTDVDVTAEYSAENESYWVVMEGNMKGLPVVSTTAYRPLKNDGSISEVTITYMGEIVYNSRAEEEYDEWGHLLLSSDMEMEDDEIEEERVIGTVEYDESGVPVSYTVREEEVDHATGEVETTYVFRAEYYDYVDVTTSVKDLDADIDAPVRYFNLQGMPVENPEKGIIVIKQTGNKTSKIMY